MEKTQRVRTPFRQRWEEIRRTHLAVAVWLVATALALFLLALRITGWALGPKSWASQIFPVLVEGKTKSGINPLSYKWLVDVTLAGIVGVGFMGMMHSYGVWGRHATPGRRVKRAKITAMCTRSAKKLKGDWSSIQGNYGPRGGKEDLSGIRTYTDIDEIIADPNVDLIDVCLHNQFHRDVAIKAMKAGKHVLVEKPFTVTSAQAKQLYEEGERNGCFVMPLPESEIRQ